MAVVNADKQVQMGHGYSNEESFVALTYDATRDSKLFADTVRLAQVNKKIAFTKAVLVVEDAFTSGGAATVKIGAESADDDAFLADTAVGTLAADYVLKEAAGQLLVVDAGDYITLDVSTADLTAGRCKLYLYWVNVQ